MQAILPFTIAWLVCTNIYAQNEPKTQLSGTDLVQLSIEELGDYSISKKGEEVTTTNFVIDQQQVNNTGTFDALCRKVFFGEANTTYKGTLAVDGQWSLFDFVIDGNKIAKSDAATQLNDLFKSKQIKQIAVLRLHGATEPTNMRGTVRIVTAK